MIFSREREKREKKREKQKSEHPKNASSLFFLSVVFEFFFFLDFLILFPSVRVRYLLYNKRTRLFGTLYYDYKSTLLLLEY